MKRSIRDPIPSEVSKLSLALFSRMLLCLALGPQLAGSARANDFRRGQLINLSDPNALAACTTIANEKECSLSINPANPKNIVAAWIGGSYKAIGTAVSLDGGKRWQQVVIPGLTVCSGGSLGFAVDPWLSFGPNGNLYHACAAGAGDLGHILVSNSTDGGLHWNSPISLDENTDTRFTMGKTSVTADSTDARYAYAAWEQTANGNRGFIKFSRTTDGGLSWEPARPIVDLGNSGVPGDPQIVVTPDGTLVCVFLELLFANSNGGTQKDAILAVTRSTDKGQTWSGPMEGPHVPVFQAIDPDTGFPYVNQNSYPPGFGPVAVDPRNGNLYAVFEDTRFNGQYADISFTMSTDRGSTWSAPIPINKAPTNIAAANRQAFIPAVAVAADGTIGVTYYDFRYNDTKPGLLTDYWLVHCHPSAITAATNPASWGNEVRLTDRSFDMETAANPDGKAYWIGDYQGLAAAGNDFLAGWSQPHDTDHDSIFFRRAGP